MKHQRHLFSLDPNIHYLNCAYKSPLLKSAERAGHEAMVKSRNPFLITADDFFDEVELVRSTFSKLVNCQPSQVVFLPSVSYGMSSVLNNIQANKNQHALTLQNEFPSGYFSLERWCRTHQAELKIIDLERDGQDHNQRIIDCINNDTAVVVMSATHWMSGFIFDLEKIGERCRSVGARLVVDGSQTAGAWPVDVKKTGIDALICAGYKWLFGPYSLCIGYIGSEFNGGQPLEEAWMNRTYARDFSGLTRYDSEYNPDAGRYNMGQASHLITMPMLHEGLKQILDWKVENIKSYNASLVKPLFNYLELEAQADQASHLLSLDLPARIDDKLLSINLKKHKVYLSIRGSRLRVSINVYNTNDDIDMLVDVLKMSER